MERRILTSHDDNELRVLQAEEGDGSTIVGYAAVFDSLSSDLGGFRERIAPGAFDGAEGSDVRALVDHEPSRILGRTRAGTLQLLQDDRGLLAKIRPGNTSAGRDIVESVRRGDVSGMSFGFRTLQDSWAVEEGVNIRTLVSAEVFDVSVVTFPAYPETEVALRSLEAWIVRQEPPDLERLAMARQRLELALRL